MYAFYALFGYVLVIWCVLVMMYWCIRVLLGFLLILISKLFLSVNIGEFYFKMLDRGRALWYPLYIWWIIWQWYGTQKSNAFIPNIHTTSYQRRKKPLIIYSEKKTGWAMKKKKGKRKLWIRSSQKNTRSRIKKTNTHSSKTWFQAWQTEHLPASYSLPLQFQFTYLIYLLTACTKFAANPPRSATAKLPPPPNSGFPSPLRERQRCKRFRSIVVVLPQAD